MFIKLNNSLHKADELLMIEKAGDRIILTFDNKNESNVMKTVDELLTSSFTKEDVEPQLSDIPFIKEMLDDKIYLEVKKDTIVNTARISHAKTEFIDGDVYVGIYMQATHFGVLSTKKEFSFVEEGIQWMDLVFGKRGMILNSSLKK